MRTTSLVLMMVLLLVATGCGKERWKTEDPQEALEMFIRAVYFNNTQAAWHFLPEEARTDLTKRAERLNAGMTDRSVVPHQLLASSGFLGPHHVARIATDKTASSTETTTTLLLTTQSGQEHRIGMVRVDGVWRVKLERWPML